MDQGKVCIEVALNGPWTRRLQPAIPLTPDEIVTDAIECAKAGASIIHFHAYDASTGEQTTEFDLVARIIEQIRAKVDAVVYPAIRYMSNAESIQDDAGRKRYAHLERMAARGLAEWLIVDPGSTNLVSYHDIGAGKKALVDINTPSAIRFGLEVAAKYKLHPGFAIYEPGYLRLGAALARAVESAPMPMYRLMFSDELTFGYRPREYALRSYLDLLAEEAPGAPWMVAGLGVDIRPLIPIAAQLGGHVRVGLEDARLGSRASNPHLVEEAVKLIENADATVATPAQLRAELFTPSRIASTQVVEPSGSSSGSKAPAPSLHINGKPK